MMSLSTIHRMSDEQARKAAVRRKVPYVPFDEKEADTFGRGGVPFPFPDLGNHEPHGWDLAESLFCDATGFGGENEPALTPGQLRERVKEIMARGDEEGKTYGFAITEVGQFQLYVGVFERTAAADDPLLPPPRSDLIDALKYAIEEEHPCEDTQGCDIAFALENDFVLWAGHLLMGATECPLTDEAWGDLVANDGAEGFVGRTQKQADEERDEMYRECGSCNSVYWGEDVGSRCANCHAKWPVEDGDEDDGDGGDDDGEGGKDEDEEKDDDETRRVR